MSIWSSLFSLSFFRKQCIYSDSRLDFLKELMKNIPDVSEECNDTNLGETPAVSKIKQLNNDDSDEEV